MNRSEGLPRSLGARIDLKKPRLTDFPLCTSALSTRGTGGQKLVILPEGTTAPANHTTKGMEPQLLVAAAATEESTTDQVRLVSSEGVYALRYSRVFCKIENLKSRWRVSWSGVDQEHAV